MNGTLQAGTGISNWRAFFLAVTIVACGGSLSVAAYAWFTPWEESSSPGVERSL